MKTKAGLVSIMLLVLILAMTSAVSAATVDLVEKDGAPDWNVVPGGKNGTLSYTMPATTMTYTFTLNSALDASTEYCLVFYTRNSESISWDNAIDEVWSNQGSQVIKCATTDGAGALLPMIGTFDFSLYGTGLDYINDGDDYDGSVLGAKVWLVPSSALTGNTVTGWGDSANFLFEEDLIIPTIDPNIPEFSTIAIPVVSILGLLFLFSRRRSQK